MTLLFRAIMRSSAEVRSSLCEQWALYCHWQFFLSLFFLLSYLDPINVTDELWLSRAYSFNVSGCDSAFRDCIRERDRKCMVSSRGGLLASAGVWAKLEAAHVFPLEYENLWNQFGYSRWITNMDETTGLSKINSVQNGLLMARDLHAAFDQCFFSVNPDVGTLSLFFFFFFFFFLCVCVFLPWEYWHNNIGRLQNSVFYPGWRWYWRTCSWTGLPWSYQPQQSLGWDSSLTLSPECAGKHAW